MTNPVEEAIKIAGKQTELAHRCGVTQQTISRWLIKGRVPLESIEKVLAAIDYKIPAHELCPAIKFLANNNRP
jgi:transcriptional regulator with XRE-family HTH domain